MGLYTVYLWQLSASIASVLCKAARGFVDKVDKIDKICRHMYFRHSETVVIFNTHYVMLLVYSLTVNPL
jgi:hypothetical protein